jgi:hypothetical protein
VIVDFYHNIYSQGSLFRVQLRPQQQQDNPLSRKPETELTSHFGCKYACDLNVETALSDFTPFDGIREFLKGEVILADRGSKVED